jgi:hypothetical protein
MTSQEFDAFRRLLVRAVPATGRWFNDRAHELAAMNRTTPDDEADAMRDVWIAAFRDVDLAHASRVVEMFASGDLSTPPYSDLCPFICRESLAIKNATYREEPRQTYRCLACCDAGTLDVYNAKWVATHWDAITDGTLPPNWPRTEHADLGQRGTLLVAAMVCNCDCKNAQVYRKQYERWIEEKRGGQIGGRPARTAFYRQYNPEEHCICRERSAGPMAAELKEWCDNHPRTFSGNWTPDSSGYARATS